jgi:hypothetical protein
MYTQILEHSFKGVHEDKQHLAKVFSQVVDYYRILRTNFTFLSFCSESQVK